MKHFFGCVAAAILFFAVCPDARAQVSQCPTGPTSNQYAALQQTTLSSAVETITLQQPTAPSKQILPCIAVAYCSVACTITISQHGTAATATALAVTRVNQSPAVTAQAFHSSNVGAGITLDVEVLAAGQTFVWDMKNLFLGLVPGDNISMASNSISGDVKFRFVWQESPQS